MRRQKNIGFSGTDKGNPLEEKKLPVGVFAGKNQKSLPEVKQKRKGLPESQPIRY